METLVKPDSVVTLNYKVSDTLGEVIAMSAPDVPESFLIGTDGLLPKIQAELLGQVPGFSTLLQIEPDDAFGDYKPELLRLEARVHFPKELEPGMQFEGLPEGCQPHEEGQFFTVTDVTDEVVVLDGNHPLAGIAVRFDLTLVSVRDATADELENGLPDEAHAQALRVLDKPHATDSHLH